MSRKVAVMTAGVLLASASNMSLAQGSDDSDVRAELEALRAEIAALKSTKSTQDKTADEIYMLAQEKAEQDAAASAGIDEKGKIYLEDADGNFSINFNGQIQFRYIWNQTTDAPAAARSESSSGFQARRMKFGMKGKVGDGWGYKFVLATSRGTGPGGGNTFTEDAYLTKKLDDNFTILFGVNKLPFARQEIISSTRQVSVDRSLVTEFFTLNRSDQVALTYKEGDVLAHFAVSDGANADFTGFGGDASNDFAVTGRAEVMVLGEDWGEIKQEFGGVDEDHLFLAGAAHYQVNDSARAVPAAAAATTDSALTWTLEALFKTGDVALSAAFFGNHTSNNGIADRDQFGAYAQASVGVGDGWDVFGRYEWIDDDGRAGASIEQLQAVTFGVNKHFTKRVKFTGDVVWIFAGDNPTADGFINGGELSSGVGLSGTGFSSATDQIAVRLQMQLLF